MAKNKNQHHPHTQTGHVGTAASDNKRFQNNAYLAFMVFAGLTILHYYLQPVMLGHDVRYTIYILWLPIIGGVAIIAYWRRKFLLDDLKHEKTFWDAFFICIFYFLEGLIFSFMSFAQLVGTGWDIANYSVAKHAQSTVIECPVDDFYRGSRHNVARYQVEFKLNGHYEEMTMSDEDYDKYHEKKPANYKLRITVQKGIWNIYQVKTWTIEER